MLKVSTNRMNKLSVTLGACLIALILVITGCGGGASLSKADAAKKELQYKYAADLYTVLAPKVKDKKEQQRAREEAAFCYRMANEFEKSIKAYEKVIKKDPKNTEALYQLGNLNMKIAGDCNKDALKEARDYLSKYLQEVPNDERALKKIAAIDSAESWKKDIPNSRYKVVNLKVVNTKGMEYSPMIASKKDDLLYFSTDRIGGAAKKKTWATTGNSYSDMWFIKAKKAKRNAPVTWEKPVFAEGSINSKYNDGSCVFDRKYATIYYTQCNGADGKSVACKLYQAKLVDGKWEQEQMLSFCADDSFDYGHPALSEDGKTLYFSSNRPDGEGGYDIWSVTYNQRAKSWGTPFNLGNTINTEYDEMFPAYNIHDNNLYFSSNGHTGMGGLDIYKCEGSGTEWTAPENMRAPINSGGDDYGMTWDNNFDINKGEHGFFTSNRCEGKGNFDIYEFFQSPCVIELEGYVYECAPGTSAGNLSKPLKNSVITITNDKDSVKVVVKTDENGYYSKIRLKEKTNYEITCQNLELYYFDAIPVQLTTKGRKCAPIKQDFCLKSQIIVQTVPIFYDLDKANIRKDAAQVLDDSILPILQKYPKLRMELGSHTDCRSSFDYNKDLSQRRADSAVAYLVRKGINKNRLVAFGYGESQLVNGCACEGPVKSNCDEKEHQKNRRTTIRTLDVNFDPNMKDVTNNGLNENQKPIIVKVTKKDPNFTVPVAGNGIEASTLAIIAAGADHFISIAELKNLIAKGQLKQENLTGITIADIQAGRLKPNATVKLNSLRIGAKDVNAFTAMNVVLKINNTPVAYTLGKDGLNVFNGTLNAEEAEIKFTNVNKEALKDGPIQSNGTKDSPGAGGTTGGAAGTTKAPAADTVNLANYKSINLIDQGGAKYIPTMLNDKENVNWRYDEASRKIEIPEDLAVQLLESGAITKANFEDGEKIVTKSGKKLPSKVIIIEKLQIGDVVLENVKVSINSNIDEPVFGGQNTQLKKLKAVIKGMILYLLPKEKKGAKSDE